MNRKIPTTVKRVYSAADVDVMTNYLFIFSSTEIWNPNTSAWRTGYKSNIFFRQCPACRTLLICTAPVQYRSAFYCRRSEYNIQCRANTHTHNSIIELFNYPWLSTKHSTGSHLFIATIHRRHSVYLYIYIYI